MSEDPMVAEFFEELNDKFYPQIMEGIDLMDGGEVKQGIETLARPLHTIKGVAGFMPGFEGASTFTHKVESFLKKLSADELEATEQNVSEAGRAVQMVFQVLEGLRENGPDVADVEAETLLEKLEELSGAGAGSAGINNAGLELEIGEEDGRMVLKIFTWRVHLKDQREKLVEAMDKIESGRSVRVDLSEVRSINSACWEAMEQYAEKLKLTVSGLSREACETFFSWGFDEHIGYIGKNGESTTVEAG